MTQPLSIFLCYASQDKPAVRELYTALKLERWLDPWLDKAKILPGQDWRIIIEKAVEAADVVIVCLSNQSVTKDGYVQKEIRYAYDIALEKPEETIFLIPLRLDECKVPRGLSHLQWVDYFGSDKRSAYTNLIESLDFRYTDKQKLEEKKQEKNTGKPSSLPSRKMEPSKKLLIRKSPHLFWIGAAMLSVLILALFIGNYFKNYAAINPLITSTATFTDPTSTVLPSVTDTPVSVASTPALGIGSVIVSEKDRMALVYVPQGKFLMGSDTSDANERPLREVDLNAFWIDRTEVTNDMFMLCVQAGGCKKPNDVSHYVNSKYADHPVVYVTWNDATDYCSWAGRRLPTEAEWEKAARGTNANIYPWGNDAPNKELLNYDNNVGDTTRVGKYPNGASVYGALDMAGNVWEWVNDWYEETYYLHSTSSNPQGPDSGTSRVLRGGTWVSDEYSVHASDRVKAGQTLANFYIGFRCAQSP